MEAYFTLCKHIGDSTKVGNIVCVSSALVYDEAWRTEGLQDVAGAKKVDFEYIAVCALFRSKWQGVMQMILQDLFWYSMAIFCCFSVVMDVGVSLINFYQSFQGTKNMQGKHKGLMKSLPFWSGPLLAGLPLFFEKLKYAPWSSSEDENSALTFEPLRNLNFRKSKLLKTCSRALLSLQRYAWGRVYAWNGKTFVTLRGRMLSVCCSLLASIEQSFPIPWLNVGSFTVARHHRWMNCSMKMVCMVYLK